MKSNDMKWVKPCLLRKFAKTNQLLRSLCHCHVRPCLAEFDDCKSPPWQQTWQHLATNVAHLQALRGACRRPAHRKEHLLSQLERSLEDLEVGVLHVFSMLSQNPMIDQFMINWWAFFIIFHHFSLKMFSSTAQLSGCTWTPLGGRRSSVHLAALIVLFRRSVEPRTPSVFGCWAVIIGIPTTDVRMKTLTCCLVGLLFFAWLRTFKTQIDSFWSSLFSPSNWTDVLDKSWSSWTGWHGMTRDSYGFTGSCGHPSYPSHYGNPTVWGNNIG